MHFEGCFINFTTIEKRMLQGDKLVEERVNKPIPLSLQWMRRKGRRKEGLPQLLSAVLSREKDMNIGVHDTP